MATELRDIHGDVFLLGDEAKVIETLRKDGALIICGESAMEVKPNDANLVLAHRDNGDLGFITRQYFSRNILLTEALGKILFLLHDKYAIGPSTLLLPVPIKNHKTAETVSFTATHFGRKEDASLTFQIIINGSPLIVRGSDILVCRPGVARTLPYVAYPYAGSVFATETKYHAETVDGVAPFLELQEDYLKVCGDELYRDDAGNVVWAKERFMGRFGKR